MNGIALNLRALGRKAEIEPLLREALRIRCRAMGADCPCAGGRSSCWPTR
jgi:hypothetical protein